MHVDGAQSAAFLFAQTTPCRLCSAHLVDCTADHSTHSEPASQTRFACSVHCAKQLKKQNQVDAQARVRTKEADIASLHLGGLQLSARLKISFGADPSLARPVLPANPSRYTVCHALLHLP